MSRWIRILFIVLGIVFLLVVFRSSVSLSDDSLYFSHAPDPSNLSGPTACPEGWLCTIQEHGLQYTCQAPSIHKSSTDTQSYDPTLQGKLKVGAHQQGRNRTHSSALKLTHQDVPRKPEPKHSRTHQDVPRKPESRHSTKTSKFCGSFVRKAASNSFSMDADCSSQLGHFTECSFLGLFHSPCYAMPLDMRMRTLGLFESPPLCRAFHALGGSRRNCLM